MKYEPTKDSVKQHKIPDWYEDAKFGIFFHWSLFSVPAFALNQGKNLIDMNIDGGYAASMKYSPYSEWYLNSMRIEGSPTQIHHKEVYGENYNYFNFQEAFEKANEKANMEEWAKVCKNAGAKYVVLVTKHHDGYCIWPSKHKNPFVSEYQSKRDFVGELTEAVRDKDMKMGLYYSGIFDWSFIKYPISDLKTWVQHHLPTKEYCDYSVSHIYELIEKYKPSILWNDIGFPPQYDVNKIFADYYNMIPDGVVCDRWKQYFLDDSKDKKEQIKKEAEILNEKLKNGLTGLLSNENHRDFITPEYETKFEYSEKKWELTRGLGMSFGYNQTEDEKNMLTYEEIITTLVDVVSKNGNFLLNIGPMADGTIPDMQKIPLMKVGKWLKVNGEAIYGTRCWTVQEGKTIDGKEIRYTEKPEALYVSVLSEELPPDIVIKEFEIPGNSTIELLGVKEKLEWKNFNNNLAIHVPDHKSEPVYVFKISSNK